MKSSVRQHTLKLSFEVTPSFEEAITFITTKLILSAAEVDSVYRDDNEKQYFIKFVDIETLNKYWSFSSKEYTCERQDGTSLKVSLTLASSVSRYLRIFNLPPEINDNAIAKALRAFGSIDYHVREKFPVEYKLDVYNGVRGVQMEMARQVPGHLFIGNICAAIYYDGMRKCCFYCKQGHEKSGDNYSKLLNDTTPYRPNPGPDKGTWMLMKSGRLRKRTASIRASAEMAETGPTGHGDQEEGPSTSASGAQPLPGH